MRYIDSQKWKKKADISIGIDSISVPKEKLTNEELISAIRQSIIAEHDAIILYETFANACNDEKAKKVLLDIAKEEEIHIGEFQDILNTLTGGDSNYYAEKGEKEVEDKAKKESYHTFMNWYKKASEKEEFSLMFKVLMTIIGIVGIMPLTRFLNVKNISTQEITQKFQENSTLVINEINNFEKENSATDKKYPNSQFQSDIKEINNKDNIGIAPQKVSGYNYNKVKNMVKRHEGPRSKMYYDTEGHPTIGVGFNLDRKDANERLAPIGLTVRDIMNGKTLNDKQIDYLFEKDLKEAIKIASRFVPNFSQLPSKAQEVIIDMAFNLGETRLNGFREFHKALITNDFNKAADEMMNSHWYGQVGDRSKELVSIMRSLSK